MLLFARRPVPLFLRLRQDIEVKSNLPGVGKNLRDHPAVSKFALSFNLSPLKTASRYDAAVSLTAVRHLSHIDRERYFQAVPCPVEMPVALHALNIIVSRVFNLRR